MKEGITLFQGDAFQLFKETPSSSIDLIIADPPYNLGKDYGSYKDNRNFDEYLNFSRDWLGEAKRVLKDDGTIYVFMGVRFISYIYSIMERDLGLNFNTWICWHYTQGMGKKLGYSPRHDDILMFTKSENFTFNLDSVRVPPKVLPDAQQHERRKMLVMFGTFRMSTIAMKTVRTIPPKSPRA